MAPVALANTPSPTIEAIKAAAVAAATSPVDLRTYASFDSTPAIGTEFAATATDNKPALTIQDVIADPAKTVALGRLISERGVVFFRDGNITPEQQKDLVLALARAGGAPEESGLHIHPLTFENSELGDQITWISNEYRDLYIEGYNRDLPSIVQRKPGKSLWHSDITFEKVPSAYASLQIRDLPSTGGDTLWASAYEAYDRLSPSFQQALEGLTAVHDSNEAFKGYASRRNKPLRSGERGHPDNVGDDLSAIHPVIRTNPVTGWKGVFVNPGFTKRIVELTQPESDALLNFLFDHISAVSCFVFERQGPPLTFHSEPRPSSPLPLD
jgi:alpha-ketoglutarate-dependent taurine dioxygenase